MVGKMTHNILITREVWVTKINSSEMGPKETQTIFAMCRKRREGWLQHCSLSYDQACCMHPPFVECYAVQAFSYASNLGPKLMSKEKNQIIIRKVCTLIQSLLLCCPNHHSGYSLDNEKHLRFLTFSQRINIVYNVTNIKQH